MKYWEDLGYQFLMVWDDFQCFGASIPGSITIDVASQNINSGAAANTIQRYDKKTKELRNAEIGVLLKKERVLEHELGHALGWGHLKINDHIMHPNLSLGGWDSAGLKKE
jgi:hypothetical protein